jgi:bacterioferritin-associated ferredoxin
MAMGATPTQPTAGHGMELRRGVAGGAGKASPVVRLTGVMGQCASSREEVNAVLATPRNVFVSLL